MSIPPKIRAHLSEIKLPSASKAWAIWAASSLVGARTRANRGCGLSRSACRMGRAKAAVLPEPVSAIPMMSRFWRARGMDSA